MNRRLFLKRLAQMAVAGSMPTQYFVEKVLASSTPGLGRRHLINLVGTGGADLSWHYGTFSPAHLLERPDAHVSMSAGGFETNMQSRPYKYTCKGMDLDGRDLGKHPNGARLGPAMSFAMGTSDWSRTLIWKGMDHPGVHGANNQMLLHGNSSSYAISTSGLISAVLAQTQRKPLHYVLMANEPKNLFTNMAMAEDAAVPVCIPGLADFGALTAFDSSEPQSAEVRDEINATVEKLNLEVLAKRAKLASSQAVARSFAAALDGARTVYGSNLAADPLMLYLRKYYLLEILKSFNELQKSPAVNVRAAAVTYHFNVARNYSSIFTALGNQNFSALPSYSDFIRDPSRYVTGLKDIETNPFVQANIEPERTFFNNLLTQASNYAFVDFLIRKNLSAVVDAPAWVGYNDAHGEAMPSYLRELITTHATFTCFFALQRSLAAVPLPEGGTLLDVTMIAFSTDFDRMAFHEPREFDGSLVGKSIDVGTNHGFTASVLLAGYGVQGGKVVGDVHTGPNMHALFPEPNYKYLGPLPIDLQSGAVSPSGKMVNILAVAPTILSAFGATLPAQQVTDAVAVPAVVRKPSG